MLHSEIVQEIEALIQKGKTEKAIDALVESTKDSDSLHHDNAVLISGQFNQWKRNKMLGIEQSNEELHRIELAILTLLKEKELPQEQEFSARIQSSSPSSLKKHLPLIAAILGGLSLLAVVWILAEDRGEHKAAAETVEINKSTKNKQEDKTGNTFDILTVVSMLNINAGTELEVDERFYTQDEKHYLVFQPDGNLVVYQSQEDRFTWGSVQSDGAKLKEGKACRMQTDGNLVIVDENNKWLWGTQTTEPEALIGISGNGLLVVVLGERVIWKG